MRVTFFDGHCNLCNGLVDWLIRKDNKKLFQFASLQGETALRFLGKNAPRGADPHTIIYFRDGITLERSTAVLWILFDLGGLWRTCAVLLLIPTPLRNLAYNFVAKNRYKFFGKRETCRLPTKEESERILP